MQLPLSSTHSRIWCDTHHRRELINSMSTVIANSIKSLDGGAVNTHISEDTEFVSEGGATTVASNTLTLGLIKEYQLVTFRIMIRLLQIRDLQLLMCPVFLMCGTGKIRYDSC